MIRRSTSMEKKRRKKRMGINNEVRCSTSNSTVNGGKDHRKQSHVESWDDGVVEHVAASNHDQFDVVDMLKPVERPLITRSNWPRLFKCKTSRVIRQYQLLLSWLFVCLFVPSYCWIGLKVVSLSF